MNLALSKHLSAHRYGRITDIGIKRSFRKERSTKTKGKNEIT